MLAHSKFRIVSIPVFHNPFLNTLNQQCGAIKCISDDKTNRFEGCVATNAYHCGSFDPHLQASLIFQSVKEVLRGTTSAIHPLSNPHNAPEDQDQLACSKNGPHRPLPD